MQKSRIMNKHIVFTTALATLSASALFGGDVSIGGFISNGYIQSSAHNYLVDSKDGDFAFAEAGVNATWSPAPRTVVRGQLFTFELGDYGNFDPLIDYLFVDYSVSPELGARLGRVKRAEGIYTDIQDIDVARTSVLLPIGMYDQRYRDFSAAVDGISFYGNIQAGESNSFDYNLYYGFVDIGVDSGVGGYAHTALSRSLNNAKVDRLESDTNKGLQIWWNPAVAGLRFGVSYSVYDDIELDSSGTIPGLNLPLVANSVSDIDMTRLSAEYFIGEWTLTSEYHRRKSDSLQSNSIAGMQAPDEQTRTTSDAWYASVARRFLARYEGALTYAEYYDDNSQKSLPSDYQKDLQLSFRFNATESWTLKAEMHWLEGTNRLFNQYGQNPNPIDSSWTLFAAKSTFTF